MKALLVEIETIERGEGGMFVRLRVGLQRHDVELPADSPFVVALRSLIANCEQVN